MNKSIRTEETKQKARNAWTVELRKKLSDLKKGYWKNKLKEKRNELLKKAHDSLKGTTPYNKGKKSTIPKERHWNWQGGITKENHGIRTSIEYEQWRLGVFQRDKFICQKTGQIGGKLVAHHIIPFHSSKKLRLDVNNGITLTEEAHDEFHRQFGYKNNTMEQLLLFFNKQK